MSSVSSSAANNRQDLLLNLASPGGNRAIEGQQMTEARAMTSQLLADKHGNRQIALG
tara:strand:- start:147 stop:317 length:171 start_codon:yes stop_codon:yes gene_type:complete